MRGNCSLIGGLLAMALWAGVGMSKICYGTLPGEANPSEPFHADSSQARADSTATRHAIMVSVLQRLKTRFNAGYLSAPVHPYFRDEQRVVNDMRRLVIFVDKNGVRGFESVPELVEIAQKLPVAKQTAIIRLAVAGSVASLMSETAMKQLRRHKFSFVQLEPDRVHLHTSFKGLHLSLSRNIETQSYTLRLPKLHITYVYGTYSKFTSHSVYISPLFRVGLGYMHWNELDIVNFSYALGGGCGFISHDQTRRITMFGVQMRQNKNWVGIFYVKDRRLATADWLRLDFGLVW